MAHTWNKFKCQGKVTANNHQMNVVANEKEIQVEQKNIIYTITLEGKP
jgi:hypothetical protein